VNIAQTISIKMGLKVGSKTQNPRLMGYSPTFSTVPLPGFGHNKKRGSLNYYAKVKDKAIPVKVRV
jgi:hypothetical protein